MTISEKTKNEINTLVGEATTIGTQMLDPSAMTSMFDLVERFVEDPSIYEDFKKDPSSVVKKYLGKGALIDGTHFHTADRHNNYIPAEDGAGEQIMTASMSENTVWARVEVRAGIGPLCYFNCGVCSKPLAI